MLSTRLGRVADRVDSLAERLEAAEPVERSRLQVRLTYLRRRSHVLDVAVMMGTLGGIATSLAAASVRGRVSRSGRISLFVAFGFVLLFTIGALLAFLIEMLLASRGIRDLAASAGEPEDAATHDEGGQGAAEPSGGEAAREPIHDLVEWEESRTGSRGRPGCGNRAT